MLIRNPGDSDRKLAAMSREVILNAWPLCQCTENCLCWANDDGGQVRSVTLREQSVSFVVDPALFYQTPHGPSWWCSLGCTSRLISYGTSLLWTKSLVHIFQVDPVFTFSKYVCRVAFPKGMGLSGFPTRASLHSMRIWAFKNCKRLKRYRK